MVLQAMESTNSNKPVVKVPVGISARHIHLTQEDVEKLFGKGYQLTKKKELMGGQFASNEQCTIVGLKLRAIENVRILGPVRSKSQVEISATDARTLGIKAPVRQSGDTERDCKYQQLQRYLPADKFYSYGKYGVCKLQCQGDRPSYHMAVYFDK